ncbi:MAG: proteasome activator, partial [Actinomycetota bacterium]
VSMGEDDRPGIVVVGASGGAGGEAPAQAKTQKEIVSEPAKLFRIGGMLRELLEELRRAPLDAEGRQRAKDLHLRSVEQLKAAVSQDLRDELDAMSLPFGDGVPTQSELTVSHAIVTGWFEGVFHGMQAFLMAQQGPRGPIHPLNPMNPMMPRGPQGPEPTRGGQYL